MKVIVMIFGSPPDRDDSGVTFFALSVEMKELLNSNSLHLVFVVKDKVFQE